MFCFLQPALLGLQYRLYRALDPAAANQSVCPFPVVDVKPESVVQQQQQQAAMGAANHVAPGQRQRTPSGFHQVWATCK